MCSKGRKTFGFPKAERLSARKEVEVLFKENESFVCYPFKCIYNIFPDGPRSLSVLFSVGKKYHKRAVRRNIVRRRAKEAFRLNRHIFYEGANRSGFNAAFIYIGKKEEDYRTIEYGIKKALYRLAETGQKNSDISAGRID